MKQSNINVNWLRDLLQCAIGASKTGILSIICGDHLHPALNFSLTKKSFNDKRFTFLLLSLGALSMYSQVEALARSSFPMLACN
jgi:hypothetical protein